MAASVHYELYTQDRRGWVLHARYGGNERALAIRDAETLERRSGQAVRVVRETYRQDDNHSEETLVYEGEVRPWRREAAKGAASEADAYSFSRTKKGATAFRPAGLEAENGSSSRVVARIAFVVLAALMTAMIGTGVVAVIIVHSRLPQATASLIAFLVFLSLFLTTAVPLIVKYVPQDWLQESGPAAGRGGEKTAGRKGAKKGKRKAGKAGERRWREDAQLDDAESKDEARGERRLMPHQDILAGMILPDGEPPLPTDLFFQGEEASASDSSETSSFSPSRELQDGAWNNKPQRQETQGDGGERQEPPEDAEAGVWKEERPGKEARKDNEDAQEEETLPPVSPPLSASDHFGESSTAPFVLSHFWGLGRCRSVFQMFVDEKIGCLESLYPQLNAYTKFGVSLYLAGAGDALAQKGALKTDEALDLFCQGIEALGAQPEQALHLARRLETYGKEARYRSMIDAGRQEMSQVLNGEKISFAAFEAALKRWNAPKFR